MINIKDNIFLSEKTFILNEKNHKELVKNSIKRILVCTEYIDAEILKNEPLCKFLTKENIVINFAFDTKELIFQTRFKMKGTEEFNDIRDALRKKQLRENSIIKELSTFCGNILLVCNKTNKMSPVFSLLIENYKTGKYSDALIDSLPPTDKKIMPVQRAKDIVKYYNMLKH